MCLIASCTFAGAGLLVVFVVYPYFEHLSSFIAPEITEIVALVFSAFFFVNISLTVSSLTNILQRVLKLDDSINDHMTELVDSLYNTTSAIGRGAVSRIKGVRFKKPYQMKFFSMLADKIKNKF